MQNIVLQQVLCVYAWTDIKKNVLNSRDYCYGDTGTSRLSFFCASKVTTLPARLRTRWLHSLTKRQGYRPTEEVYLLSRDGSRRRGGKTDTILPYWMRESSSQKVTVRKECGSRRCSHLSDLGSPDIGRGKREKPNDWLGPPKRKWGSLPLREVNSSKVVFEQRSWQTDDSHFTPG